METRVERGQAREDRVTGAIERQTSLAPSSLLLGLALGSMAISAMLTISGKDDWGALCWAMGSAISHHGQLQQDGEAAWIGCDKSPRSGVASEKDRGGSGHQLGASRDNPRRGSFGFCRITGTDCVGAML